VRAIGVDPPLGGEAGEVGHATDSVRNAHLSELLVFLLGQAETNGSGSAGEYGHGGRILKGFGKRVS
jgi:hypothetical protein